MAIVRIGAVSYLNARPLVFGLEHSSAFSLRFDVPSRCAELLHDHQIELGVNAGLDLHAHAVELEAALQPARPQLERLVLSG